MSIIQSISVTEDVTLVSLQDSPADIGLISDIFTEISKNNIDVDMISQTPPHSHTPNLSFTVSDEDVGKMLEITAKLRDIYPDMKLTLRSGNCKISVFGEEMRGTPGVAAKVFYALSRAKVEVSMITTSEVDISLLVDKHFVEPAIESLEREFNK